MEKIIFNILVAIVTVANPFGLAAKAQTGDVVATVPTVQGAQGVPYIPSIPGSTKINTTNPPNMSWVVDDFEIVGFENGGMKVRLLHPRCLPSITYHVKVSQDCQKQYRFKVGDHWTLNIRERQVSSAYKL